MKYSSGWLKAAIVTALSLTLAPSLLAGCNRFGNKSSQTLRGYDTISGYYGTAPHSMQLQATVSGVERTQGATVNTIPAVLSEVMSNPVLLYLDDPIAGVGSIRNKTDNGIGFGIGVDMDTRALGDSAQATSDVAGCLVIQDITRYGSYAAASPTTVGNFTVRGRINLTNESGFSFTGDETSCAVLLQDIAACYADGAQCTPNGLNEAEIHSIFDLYVIQGIIDATEIQNVRKVRYLATYQ